MAITTTTTIHQKIISIGVLAHVDAGKTTVTEQFLYQSGVVKTLGRVDSGNTVTDALAVEKSRGITVRAATVSFQWRGTKVQLLDTPGHVDFIAEVERSLSVLDGAILVISAREGVQAQTKVIFNALRRLKIPTILFINKVDRMGVDLEALYLSLYSQLSPDCLPVQRVRNAGSREAILEPFWQAADLWDRHVEGLATRDDALLNAYLNGEPLSIETLDTVMASLVNTCEILPVYHGAALHGLGIENLLDAATRYIQPRKPETLKAPADVLSGLVYKVDRDERGNRRCYTKIFAGSLVLRQDYAMRDETFKVRQLGLLHGSSPIQTDVAQAGDIAILYDRDQLQIGDWIGVMPDGIQPEEHLAVPTLKAVVPYKDLAQRRLLLAALEQLTDEDPFLAFSIHPHTDAIEVNLFGAVQREIIEALLKDRFGIEVSIEEPTTVYQERPLGVGSGIRFMYRQGNPLAATIGLTIEPLPLGSGIVYETAVSFGDLSKSFQNAVEEGVRLGLRRGLQGWQLTDLKVTFTDSDYDSVNSTPSDFRKLAPDVVALALESCGTELLEPILAYEMLVPTYAIGRAMSDVLKMRGSVVDPDTAELDQSDTGFAIIRGLLPVATSKYYMLELADYTEGKGVLSTAFHGYQVCENFPS